MRREKEVRYYLNNQYEGGKNNYFLCKQIIITKTKRTFITNDETKINPMKIRIDKKNELERIKGVIRSRKVIDDNAKLERVRKGFKHYLVVIYSSLFMNGTVCRVVVARNTKEVRKLADNNWGEGTPSDYTVHRVLYATKEQVKEYKKNGSNCFKHL